MIDWEFEIISIVKGPLNAVHPMKLCVRHLKGLFTALLLLCTVVAMAEEVTINGINYDVVTKAKVATVIIFCYLCNIQH